VHIYDPRRHCESDRAIRQIVGDDSGDADYSTFANAPQTKQASSSIMMPLVCNSCFLIGSPGAIP